MLDSVTRKIATVTSGSDAATSAIMGSSGVTVSGSAWWSQFAGGADAPARIMAAANDSDGGASSEDINGLKSEIAELRADLTDALAQIAGYARTTASVLQRAAGRSGSEAIAVTSVAA